MNVRDLFLIFEEVMWCFLGLIAFKLFSVLQVIYLVRQDFWLRFKQVIFYNLWSWTKVSPFFTLHNAQVFCQQLLGFNEKTSGFFLMDTMTHYQLENRNYCIALFPSPVGGVKKTVVFRLEQNSNKKLRCSNTFKMVQKLIKNFKVFRCPQSCKILIFCWFFSKFCINKNPNKRTCLAQFSPAITLKCLFAIFICNKKLSIVNGKLSGVQKHIGNWSFFLFCINFS